MYYSTNLISCKENEAIFSRLSKYLMIIWVRVFIPSDIFEAVGPWGVKWSSWWLIKNYGAMVVFYHRSEAEELIQLNLTTKDEPSRRFDDKKTGFLPYPRSSTYSWASDVPYRFRLWNLLDFCTIKNSLSNIERIWWHLFFHKCASVVM